MTAATGKGKTGPKVLKTGYTVPIKPCTVSDSGLPSVQPSVLGFPVTPNQFSILSEMKLHVQSWVKIKIWKTQDRPEPRDIQLHQELESRELC